MKQNPLYCCYSVPLRDYLTAQNIRFYVVGRSVSTDKTFWVYVKTDMLNLALTQWSYKNKVNPKT